MLPDLKAKLAAATKGPRPLCGDRGGPSNLPCNKPHLHAGGHRSFAPGMECGWPVKPVPVEPHTLSALLEIAEAAGEYEDAESERLAHRAEVKAWSPEWRDEAVRLAVEAGVRFARLRAALAKLEAP